MAPETTQTQNHGGEGAQEHHPTIQFTVDGDPFTTIERTPTARQILELAHLNPEERYLIELQGKEQKSYKDDYDSPIHLHENAKFVTAATGPKTVS